MSIPKMYSLIKAAFLSEYIIIFMGKWIWCHINTVGYNMAKTRSYRKYKYFSSIDMQYFLFPLIVKVN